MIVNETVISRLAAGTRFGQVSQWSSIDSTNDWLMDQAANGAPEGLVALADHQRAGRGRLGRSWTAPPGSSLLMSVLLRPALEPPRFHLLSTALGLAARSACELVGGVAPGLKWPNDLVFGEAKLAGILAETDGSAVVVGLGLNVSSAPPGGISLDDITGTACDRGMLLCATLEAFERWLGRWDELPEAYNRACVTVGRQVRAELADTTLVGVAEDIDRSGRLLVRTGDGLLHPVSAGDVVHLRPA
jgi:BirA family biotin operon repressor/biotin-[acetyl-CoA-carboxylase] ligase